MTEDSEKRSRVTGFVPSNLWRYGFLGVILCLLAFNGLILLKWTSSSHSHVPYVNLVVALGLLLSHIAFYFTKTGWPRDENDSGDLDSIWIGLCRLGSSHSVHLSGRFC